MNGRRSEAGPLSRRCGHAIKVLLQDRGKRPADLARDLDMSQQTVNARLNGERVLDVNDLEIFANYLGVSPADLLRSPLREDVERPGGRSFRDRALAKEAEAKIPTRRPTGRKRSQSE